MFTFLMGICSIVLIGSLFCKKWGTAIIALIISMIIMEPFEKEKITVSTQKYTEAIEAFNEEKYVEAQELFEEVIKEDANYFKAQEQLKIIKAKFLLEEAQEDYADGNDYSAKRSLEKALKNDPQLEEARVLLEKMNKEITEREVESIVVTKEDVQEKEQIQTTNTTSDKWTKENIVDMLERELTLPSNIVMDKTEVFGCQIAQEDKEYYPTNYEEANILELSFRKKKTFDTQVITAEKTILDVTFEVCKKINLNKDKIDFPLPNIGIHFSAYEGEIAPSSNFYIGVNTIEEYFSKPRVNKTGISVVTGEVVTTNFDAESFYQFIINNLTMPEDRSVLIEDESWSNQAWISR